MSTEPLHIIDEIESNRDRCEGTFDRLAKWLDDRLPFLLRTHIPFGRLSAEHGLSIRNADTYAEWQHVGLPPGFVETLLGLLQREFKWPNCFFLPEDPLRLVALTQYSEEFPCPSLQCAIKETFACIIDLAEIERVWGDENGTLEAFALLVHRRIETEDGLRNDTAAERFPQ